MLTRREEGVARMHPRETAALHKRASEETGVTASKVVKKSRQRGATHSCEGSAKYPLCSSSTLYYIGARMGSMAFLLARVRAFSFTWAPLANAPYEVAVEQPNAVLMCSLLFMIRAYVPRTTVIRR